MAEYIEREALMQKIKSKFQANWEIPCDTKDRIIQEAISKVYGIIREQPTADVVPMAEAVREVFKALGVLIPENTTLEEAVESYKKAQKTTRNMAINTAKAEVAREIFAEIEKVRMISKACEKRGITYDFSEFYDELKNKYTGEQT